MLQRFKIQGNSNKIYDVDLFDRRCTCSSPLAQCDHLKKARDFAENNFRRYRDLLISSFAVEVRRCDRDRGLTWAYIINKVMDKSDVHDLYCSLCLSETRNIALYAKLMLKNYDPIKIADELIRSKKLWHTKNDIMMPMIDGYRLQAGKNLFKEDLLRRTIYNSSRLYEWYAGAFSVYRSDSQEQMIKAFAESVSNRLYAIDRLPNRSEIKTILGGPLSMDAFLFICELATGQWSKDQNDFFDIKHEYVKPNYIPKFEDYIKDISNRWIMEFYDKWFLFRFGKSNAIDLRWSEMTWGVLWRLLAVRQFGNDIADIDWKAVKIEDQELIGSHMKIDACLHKMFYGTTHFWHLKLDDDEWFMEVVKDNDFHLDLIEPKDFFEKGSLDEKVS